MATRTGLYQLVAVFCTISIGKAVGDGNDTDPFGVYGVQTCSNQLVERVVLRDIFPHDEKTLIGEL